MPRSQLQEYMAAAWRKLLVKSENLYGNLRVEKSSHRTIGPGPPYIKAAQIPTPIRGSRLGNRQGGAISEVAISSEGRLYFRPPWSDPGARTLFGAFNIWQPMKWGKSARTKDCSLMIASREPSKRYNPLESGPADLWTCAGVGSTTRGDWRLTPEIREPVRWCLIDSKG
jgi:hypothetical protein